MLDWKNIVTNSGNYQALLKLQPKTDRDDLMILFVETVGQDLAEAWICLDDKDAKRAAENWFKYAMFDFFRLRLTPQAEDLIVPASG